MNPRLEQLHTYPFQKLAELKQGLQPAADLEHIALSIGEPKHTPPDFCATVLQDNLSGLSRYPSTQGSSALREAIASWLTQRFQLQDTALDPDRHILPVNGTREALFAIAQCVVDASRSARVLMPNPFYQIYEGAALLAGAQPYYLNCMTENDFIPNLDEVPATVWRDCQLFYLCSPGNPTGVVLSVNHLRQILDLADRYDFVIAADECYSEIYQDPQHPPLGLLQACTQLGRDDFSRCLVFNSLSKRSNLPGLRSGFVAGNADLIKAFLQYRTYHGGAMSLMVQALSCAAWQDEVHVQKNRALYRAKFAAVLEILNPTLGLHQPQAGFFLWPNVAQDDTEFTRKLFTEQHITVLPGQFLSRTMNGINPGYGHVRMALVAEQAQCVSAARRIKAFLG